MPEPIPDRSTAGRRLAARLLEESPKDPVVLALPRGGAPVAYEIARVLRAPLDLLVVRKVGAPGNPEYGLGAVVEGGLRWLDSRRIREASLTERDLTATIERELVEVRRQVERYRGSRSPVATRGRTVILVDDGAATGGTMSAAIAWVRLQHPDRIIVAVGVCPPDTYSRLEKEADEVLALEVPASFIAVGQWYECFGQVSDHDVRRLLEMVPTARE